MVQADMTGQTAATPFRIELVRSARDIVAARRLLLAYAASLPVDLSYQDFASELSDLPGKYVPPAGELLIAWDEADRAMGCAGLRSLGGEGRCEMKRLYVAPEARGMGLGRALIEFLIAIARARGYAELLLDTLPTMNAAALLYRQLGFEPIRPARAGWRSAIP